MEFFYDVLGVGGLVLLALIVSVLVFVGVRVLGVRWADRRLQRAINKVSRF